MLVKSPDDRRPQNPTTKRQRVSKLASLRFESREQETARNAEKNTDPAEENVLLIKMNIGGAVTRLIRLSNAVRKSSRTNRARKIEAYKVDEVASKAIDDLRFYTRSFIKFRFPFAPEELCSALVEANALRFKRLHYQQSHESRMGFGNAQIPDRPPAVIPEAMMGASTVQPAPVILPRPSTTSALPTSAPVPATNATTAQQSGFEALYADSTTDLPQARSVAVKKNLSFPPIPPSKECPYCSIIIEFRFKELWQ
jgi:hypothetical protein